MKHFLYKPYLSLPSPHQTGLDTRSMTRKSIKVGIREGGDRARTKVRALMSMMHLAHSMCIASEKSVLRFVVAVTRIISFLFLFKYDIL